MLRLCKMSTLPVLVLILSCRQIFSYNIDITNPIVYSDQSEYLKIPQNKNSYFGYSVILYAGDNITPPWIQIGAPQSNSPASSFQNPGVVFRCSISQPCKTIQLNIPDYLKCDGAWIGGSMDIDYKSNRTVTCGYRTVEDYVSRNFRRFEDYRTVGACYWSDIDSSVSRPLLPFYNGNAIYSDPQGGGTVYNYGQGQAGFTAHFPKNGEELLLGAPGVYNWHGTPLLYKDSDGEPVIANKFRQLRRKRQLINIEGFRESNIANARLTTEVIAYDLLGYSVSSGTFYDNKQMYYAAAGPKSKNYRGQVLIFKFSRNNDQALQVRESKQGTQFGEYFGASLSSGDINGDGYDDLIVGAPYYKAARYNEGRFYVFLGGKGSLQDPLRGALTDGKAEDGQLGANVMFLGDIDMDGFGDVAVSAPYEDSSGVVYIYKGEKEGIDPTPSQRIVGDSVLPNLRGFGIAISKSADVDYNGVKDIAIGAPLSGHVVLLRGKPTVTIYHELNMLAQRLIPTSKSISINYCFWFYGNQVDTVDIERIIDVDPKLNRATLNGQITHLKPLTLARHNRFCENATLFLKEKFTNNFDPLQVKLSHRFIKEERHPERVIITDSVDGIDRFCLRCPVYNRYGSSKAVVKEISFSLGCGEDNICTSYLEIEPTFVGIRENTFILGSSRYITMQTKVTNKQEKAYLTKLMIILPEGISLQNNPTTCQSIDSKTIICDVENVLNQNDTKTVSLSLDTKNVNYGKSKDSLMISLKALTSSENKNPVFKNITLKLTRQADITITGKSGEQNYYYKNLTDGQQKFTQLYEVTKYGASPIEKVSIILRVPYAIKDGQKQTQFLKMYPLEGYLGGQPLTWKSEFKYITEDKFNPSDGTLTGEQYETKNVSKRSIMDPETETINSGRQINSKYERLTENTEDLLPSSNRTFYVNCSMSNIVCADFLSYSGPYKEKQSAAIELKMVFNISVLEKYLKGKGVVLISTQGKVKIEDPIDFVQSGDRPDDVVVSSLFLSEIPENRIALWIIIVSVIVGLLLLLLLILALVKVGFFARKKKDELALLKAELQWRAYNEGKKALPTLAKSEN